MSIRARLAAALAPKQPQRLPYREAEETPADVLREVEDRLAGLSLRVRVLERQLVAQGIVPVDTPSGYHLRLAADVIEGKHAPLNTLELGMLARMLRGLATWSE